MMGVKRSASLSSLTLLFWWIELHIQAVQGGNGLIQRHTTTMVPSLAPSTTASTSTISAPSFAPRSRERSRPSSKSPSTTKKHKTTRRKNTHEIKATGSRIPKRKKIVKKKRPKPVTRSSNENGVVTTRVKKRVKGRMSRHSSTYHVHGTEQTKRMKKKRRKTGASRGETDQRHQPATSLKSGKRKKKRRKKTKQRVKQSPVIGTHTGSVPSQEIDPTSNPYVLSSPDVFESENRPSSVSVTESPIPDRNDTVTTFTREEEDEDDGGSIESSNAPDEIPTLTWDTQMASSRKISHPDDDAVHASSTDILVDDGNMALAAIEVVDANPSHATNMSPPTLIAEGNVPLGIESVTGLNYTTDSIEQDIPKFNASIESTDDEVANESGTSTLDNSVLNISTIDETFHPTGDVAVTSTGFETPLIVAELSSLSTPPNIEEIDFVNAADVVSSTFEERIETVSHSFAMDERNEIEASFAQNPELPEATDGDDEANAESDEPQVEADKKVTVGIVHPDVQSNTTETYESSSNVSTATERSMESETSKAAIGTQTETSDIDVAHTHTNAEIDVISGGVLPDSHNDENDDDDDDSNNGDGLITDISSDSGEKSQAQDDESIASTPSEDGYHIVFEAPLERDSSDFGQPSDSVDRSYPSLAPVQSIGRSVEDSSVSVTVSDGSKKGKGFTPSESFDENVCVFEEAMPTGSPTKDDKHLTISIVTWNLAEESPSEEDASFIKRFRKNGKDRKNGSDLVLISGQECENIKPRRSEGSRSREFRRLMIMMLGKDYVPLALHLLGGIQFGLFCKRSILGDIEQASVADVSCGIGNVFHNKGAIGCFLKIKAKEKATKDPRKPTDKSVRMLFVTAHMAAHVKNTEARDSDFWRIVRELEIQAPSRFLSKSNPLAETNGKFLLDSTDRIFFCGDLNYRIDLPREEVEYTVSRIQSLLDSKMPQERTEVNKLRECLFKYDQLRATIALERAFPGFAEGRITFAPTFKFDKGTDEYDTSHKQRIPAWTDRVLYKPVGTHVLEYESIVTAQHSDHRPVFATFSVDITGRVLSGKKRRKR